MRPLAMIVFVLWTPLLCSGQKSIDWLPITEQDRQIKDVPASGTTYSVGTTGASAIQLYYSYYKDDNDKFVQVYQRIKVLREAGKKYADVQIVIEPDVSLKELAARTIKPDGTIVDFKDKPFEKTIIKRRGVKLAAKTFTFPDVGVGSIVEYKYTLGLPLHRVKTISLWELQSDLFTVRADFRFRAYQGVVRLPYAWSSINNARYSQVAYAYLHQFDARLPDQKKGNFLEFHLENIPAFVSEEYMPPEDDFKPVIYFYYGGHEIVTPDKYWDEVGKTVAPWAEKFIGNFQGIRDVAAQTTANEADPEKQLRKLYDRAQQIRNTSYERPRSEEERKEERIKNNENVTDVLGRGYGTSFDISALFAALARAAGFEANVVFMADRRYQSFERLVLSLEQIDSTAVQVKLRGKDIILSPGTRYCPFGLLPWEHSAVTALKFSRSGAEFITTPAPEASLVRRTAKMALSADGSLTGEIAVELDGQEALEHRLAALDTDEAGRTRRFEDELQQALSQGSIVKLKASEGWDSRDNPLIATFTVEIPGFAAVTGKRLIARALLFASFQGNMFNSDSRIYPIVFSYPFTERDEVHIKLPHGYTLEAPPFRRKAGLYYAAYETESLLEDNQLVTRRSLRLDRVSFPPEEYLELKNFFDVVKGGDEGQALFTTEETGKSSADAK